MSGFICGFKEFYDGNIKSMADVFRLLKERPYLMYMNNVLVKEEDWQQFKAALMDAFRAGYDYRETIGAKAEEVIAPKASADKPALPEFHVLEEKKEAVRTEKPKTPERVTTATVAAYTTCEDYERIRKWCEENGVKRYGKGFILTESDYSAWCDFVGFKDKHFPVRNMMYKE